MSESTERSCFVVGAIYFGAICLLITLISAVNLGLSLNLALSISGATVDLPNDWVAIAILGFIGATTFGLGKLIGSDSIVNKVKDKPIIVLPILIACLLCGYGTFVQIDYYTYGGKHSWAAAKDRVDVLEQYFENKEVSSEEKAALLKLVVVYKKQLLTWRKRKAELPCFPSCNDCSKETSQHTT